MQHFEHGGADAPGLAAPAVAQKGEGPAGTTPQTPQFNAQHDEANHATTGTACVAGADPLKPWRTAQAKCILAGYHASLIDDDAGRPMLIVSRWALCKSFSSVAEVEAWLVRVEGRAS